MPLADKELQALLNQGVPLEHIAQIEAEEDAAQEAATKLRQAQLPAAPKPQRDDSLGGVASRFLSGVGDGIINLPANVLNTARGINAMVGMPTLPTFGGMRPYKAEAEVPKAAPVKERAVALGDALKSSVKDIASKVANPKEAFLEDPAGTLGELSLLLSGSGKGLQAAGKAGKLARALQTAGTVTNPMQAVTLPLRGAASVIDKTKLPEFLMESALKPTKKYLPEDRKSLIASALRNKIVGSEAGLDKAEGLINNIEDGEVAKRIAELKAAGKLVDMGPVYREGLTSAIQKFSSIDPDGPSAINATDYKRGILQVAKEMKKRHSEPPIPAKPAGLVDAQGQPIMTKPVPRKFKERDPEYIQEEKRKTYALNRSKYAGRDQKGNINEPGALAAKSFANQERLALEALDEQTPRKVGQRSLSEANREIGELVDVKKSLADRLAVERNNQLIGWPTALASAMSGATGAAVGGGQTAAASAALPILLRYLDRTRPKSLAALAADKVRRTKPNNDLLQLFNLISQTNR